MRGALSAVLAAVLLAGGSLGEARADEYLAYSGTASDLKSRAFLYSEKHVLRERAGKLAERVVLYTCHDGSAFARKNVAYVQPFAPDFDFEDASNGVREGVRSTAGGRVVYFRRSQGDAERSAPLPTVPDLVVDAGFDEFVRARWQTLAGAQTLGIHFLIPSRLDELGFKVDELRKDSAEGVPVDVFRLKLSGIFGWFLPGIDVYYSTTDHILVRFVGLSDLRDAAGDNMKVDILFDPKDRHPVSEDAFAAARRAPLAACH